MEYSEGGHRESDNTYPPRIFEDGSGNVEAAIIQNTERFFALVKQKTSINYLAERAAEEGGGWSEEVDMIPLEKPGKKPMRMVTQLRYYDEITVASVVQDFLPSGSIAVSFNWHIPSAEQYSAAFGEVEQLDTIITQQTF